MGSQQKTLRYLPYAKASTQPPLRLPLSAFLKSS
ncbi:hypothetical protein PSHT_00586 [Puccinia striiformis]|uniref:Uncharacterized protein n=1 Tax=Puccinia striiformis TaxID=27350 RepID=A0A2S4WMR2_9BASI|nr:hypothetical protein PSHT_00586 [Puccinia striiformis]